MKEEKPLVSFIITYYNLPMQMLQECIDSILSLSLRPAEREIILIDDGSELSPINDLMKFGDDIIYLRQRNGGLSMARNKGLDIAQGKYIQFVDADDYLIQKTYEQCLDIIRYAQDCDMVIFDFSTSPDVTYKAEEIQPPVSGSELMRHQNIHGTAWGYLFRHAILGNLRFTPGVYHEDEEFTPQLLLRAETVFQTPIKAYFYRQRQDSITSKKNEEDIQKRLDDKRDVIFRLHEQTDKLPHDDRLAMERRTAQLTMDYLYNIILQTRSKKELERRMEELSQQGLFPLPDRDYTTKYKWFRRMTQSSLGRTFLLRTLPLLKKER